MWFWGAFVFRFLQASLSLSVLVDRGGRKATKGSELSGWGFSSVGGVRSCGWERSRRSLVFTRLSLEGIFKKNSIADNFLTIVWVGDARRVRGDAPVARGHNAAFSFIVEGRNVCVWCPGGSALSNRKTLSSLRVVYEFPLTNWLRAWFCGCHCQRLALIDDALNLLYIYVTD